MTDAIQALREAEEQAKEAFSLRLLVKGPVSYSQLLESAYAIRDPALVAAVFAVEFGGHWEIDEARIAAILRRVKGEAP